MTKVDYVLRLSENTRRALWGEERWVVSVHPSARSVVTNGPLAGKTLAEVLPGFSLLFKVIDARKRLSVQVHPSMLTAPLIGGEPKTEAWCMLNDGIVYAGLKPGVSVGDVATAVSSGRFEELLVRHEAKKGDMLLVPGGMVHAIDGCVRLYEVQQSSDTTYRLYDWRRVDADGKPRELHVEKSLATIDYSLPAPVLGSVAECPFFDFRQMEVCGRMDFAPHAEPVVLFAAEGPCMVNGEELREGESALVPPSVGFTLTSASAKVFITHCK
jgi:mannose-6-phosphate isomerase